MKNIDYPRCRTKIKGHAFYFNHDGSVAEDVENSELIIITDPNEVNELKKLGAKFERIDLTVLNYPDPLTTWSEI